MITVKIEELLNSVETLQKLSQKDFKAKLAWQVARLLKAAEAEIQAFNGTRLNLIKKYGEKDDQGELITDEKGNCKIVPAQVEQFTTELNDLISSEVEINVSKINIEQLENIDFTPNEMAILEPFIEMNE